MIIERMKFTYKFYKKLHSMRHVFYEVFKCINNINKSMVMINFYFRIVVISE